MFCIFFFCPSHLYAILLYLLVSTVTFSHHCFFHDRHLSTFPLLLLACNIGDFDSKCAPLFSSNHRTSETDKPQSSDFQLSGTGHCIKKPKESKQKNPFSKLLWNFDRIWGYSGDTKNRKNVSRENNVNISEFEFSKIVALKYHRIRIGKNQW